MTASNLSPRFARTPLIGVSVLALIAAMGTTTYSVEAQTVGSASAGKALEAAQALRRGDDSQAISELTTALGDLTLPNETRATYLNDRGTARVRQQQFRLAVEDFNRAAQLYPEYAATYVNRGNLLLALGQADEALKDFARAIVLAPNLSAAYNNRAAAYLKMGRSDLALVDATKAIELNPRDAVALVGRGRAHLAQNRRHAAMRDYSRAIALNSGFVQAYRYRAEIRFGLGQTEDAAGDLSRALAYDPRRVDDYLARGDAYLAADNVAAALKDYSRVLELRPNSVPGYIGRGYAHAKLGAHEEALDDLGRALEIDPRSVRAYAVRVWVYIKMQQPTLGEKDVERLVRLEPTSADTHWAQGEIEESLGRGDGAVIAYQKALALAPQHRDVIAAMQRIGIETIKDETDVSGAGIDKWRVLASGDDYVAVNELFPKVRIPLEMMSKGAPKLLDWERKKSPNSNFGVLRYAAGSMQTGAANDVVENSAVIDVASAMVMGVVVARMGRLDAKWSWDDGAVTVTGADGLVEEFRLKSRSKDDRDAIAAIANAPMRRASVPSSEAGSSPKSNSSVPSWAPWAQNTPGASSSTSQRESRPKPKPKSIFDMLFGN
ncbi:MAG: tetratricopeptide repeat protein [Hyphomicrobiaceae bacterium]